MAKRKHPKLPNGFGSIKKLSGNRTNPYAVYPPTEAFTATGSPITQKALCYVNDWYTGFYALMDYKNGTFDPDKYASCTLSESGKAYDVISKIIASYNNASRNQPAEKTFSEVYEAFFDYKYIRNKTREYSTSTINATKAAFGNAAALHTKPFRALKTEDLQKIVDDCTKSHASKEHIINLFNQMYAYADANDLCNKKYSDYVKINTPDDDEQGVPFSEAELLLLWEHCNDNTILQNVLVMIYSGFRISAYRTMEINFKEQYFKGGVKTSASKNRIVPFHPLIVSFISADTELFTVTASTFRGMFVSELERIGITGHTPHDCRHTFSWLCDKYKVDGLTKKMLLGHALGNSVTDAVYGHRTLDELRAELSKIQK